MFRVSCFIFLCLMFLVSCSTQRIAAQLAFPLVQGQYKAMQEEADLGLAAKAIPSNLKMMEGLLKGDESSTPILNNLAEGFCSYSFSFIEDSNPERASALYQRGRGYAVRSLAESSGVKDLLTLTGEEFQFVLKGMNANDLPALFWLGQCWSGWLMLNLGSPETFADISRVEWLMKRTAELDEDYHYAGPHLALGGFYGSRTKMLGGDPEKARYHFERNLELNQRKFLLTQLIYARTYAVQSQDKELFGRLLKEILDSSSNALPEQRLANEVAKQKARKLLDMADELF
ncbi:MAG: TRAP transporter TatT component family protein [Nitrospinaceae bacterium]|nr:TRAP transporter TatT component family protein [Nitrospinaceae bacterium]